MKGKLRSNKENLSRLWNKIAILEMISVMSILFFGVFAFIFMFFLASLYRKVEGFCEINPKMVYCLIILLSFGITFILYKASKKVFNKKIDKLEVEYNEEAKKKHERLRKFIFEENNPTKYSLKEGSQLEKRISTMFKINNINVCETNDGYDIVVSIGVTENPHTLEPEYFYCTYHVSEFSDIIENLEIEQ